MTIYGFRGLVKDFLSSHPGHYINPRSTRREPNRKTTIVILHSIFDNLNLDGNQLHLVSAVK